LLETEKPPIKISSRDIVGSKTCTALSSCTLQDNFGPRYRKEREEEQEIGKDEYVSYLPAVKTAQSCVGRQKDEERERERRGAGADRDVSRSQQQVAEERLAGTDTDSSMSQDSRLPFRICRQKNVSANG